MGVDVGDGNVEADGRLPERRAVTEPTVSRDQGASGAPPPRPGWVKVLLVAVVVLIVVVVVTTLLGVEHGPSRHGSTELHGAGSAAAHVVTAPGA